MKHKTECDLWDASLRYAASALIKPGFVICICAHCRQLARTAGELQHTKQCCFKGQQNNKQQKEQQ